MKTEISADPKIKMQPSSFLRDVFLVRKEKNPAYSMRAFARDLGMSQTLLSLVLSHQRPLTLRQAYKISVLLQLHPRDEKAFIDCVLQALPENAKVSKRWKGVPVQNRKAFEVKNLEIENFYLISKWYHFAILDLTTTVNFISTAASIAERLQISKAEVDAALERLLLLGLIEKKNGRFQKSSLHFYLPTHESKTAVRALHEQMMEKAKEALKKTDLESFQKRSISGCTLAIDSSQVEEAKKMIDAFKQSFIKRFTQGKPDEVYDLSVQFFPLTHSQNKKLKDKIK